jgi:hypothetical protein
LCVKNILPQDVGCGANGRAEGTLRHPSYLIKGKIFYNTTVESSYSMEHVLFSENILAEQADIVLADAIEKLFEDKNVAQKLKETLAQQN